MNDLCVVIPLYKRELSKNEMLSVERTFKVLEKRKIYFIVPKSLNTDFYTIRYPKANYKFFPDKYFQSVSSYNRLMLKSTFYSAFSEYEYMLIAQPDAMILQGIDLMDRFMDTEFDYIGAPWHPPLVIYRFDFKKIKLFGRLFDPVLCFSGNGGFCLRNIRACAKLLTRYSLTANLWCNNYNEDGFFSYFGHSKKEKFSIASFEISSEFALEGNMKEALKSGKRPFAVHAWEKYFDEYSCLEKYIETNDR